MWEHPIGAAVAAVVAFAMPAVAAAWFMFAFGVDGRLVASAAPLKQAEAWHFVGLVLWHRSVNKARQELFQWYRSSNLFVDLNGQFGMSVGTLLGCGVYLATLETVPSTRPSAMFWVIPLVVVSAILGYCLGHYFRRRFFFLTSTDLVKSVLHARSATELGHVNRLFNQVLFGEFTGLSINSFESSTTQWHNLHGALAASVAQCKPLLEQALRDHVGLLNGRATFTRDDVDEFFARVWFQFLFGSHKHPALARPELALKSPNQSARDRREWPAQRLELFKTMHKALQSFLLTEFHNKSNSWSVLLSTATVTHVPLERAASLERALIFDDIETFMQSVKDWRYRLSLTNFEGELDKFINAETGDGGGGTETKGDFKTATATAAGGDKDVPQDIVDCAKAVRRLLKTEIPACARGEQQQQGDARFVDVDAPVSFADALEQELLKRFPDAVDNDNAEVRRQMLRDNMVLAVLVLDFVRTVELEWLISVTTAATMGSDSASVAPPMTNLDVIDKWPQLRQALTKAFFFPWRVRRVREPIVLKVAVETNGEREPTATRTMHDIFAAPAPAPAPSSTPSAPAVAAAASEFSLVPGDLVMINLVDSGFFFSTGPRSCIGKSAFLWIHEFFAEHVQPQLSPCKGDSCKSGCQDDSKGDSKRDDSKGDFKDDSKRMDSQASDTHPASLGRAVSGHDTTTHDDLHPASFSLTTEAATAPTAPSSPLTPLTTSSGRQDEADCLYASSCLQLDARHAHAETLPRHIGTATWTRTFSRRFLKSALEATEFKGVKSFFNVLDVHRRPAVVDYMVRCFMQHVQVSGLEFDAFASPESRGWLITGDLCAMSRDPNTGARRPIHTIRKAGKLPPGIKSGLVRASYSTSYSAAKVKQVPTTAAADDKSPPSQEQVLEMVGSPDLVGQRIVLVDDGISGGGTVLACAGLLEQCGATIVLVFCPLNHSYAKRKPEFVERFESRGRLLTCFDM